MIVYGTPPAGATQVCTTILNAVEVDKVDKTFLAGVTLDANRVLGQTALPCFTAGKWRGYITRHDSLTLTWQKFIHGQYGSTLEHPLVSIPWVGLSKSAQNHNYQIYTTYLGVYIRMARNDFLAFADAATGDFLSMQKIQTSAVNTFGGYSDTQYHKLYNNMLMLQTLVHNGALTDYRIFTAFEDQSTFAGNIFTLQSRSTTQLIQVNDNVTKYRYGVQCLNFLQHVYFGGAREFVGTNTGVTPLLGRANPTTLAIIEAFTLNGPDGSTNDPRYVVEQIYLSHDATNNWLFAFARKRKNGVMDEVEQIDRLMMIIGRDHLAATPWQGNPGCWKYTTQLLRVPMNGFITVDDFTGPIAGFLYVYVRVWDNSEALFVNWNEENNFRYYSVEIERWSTITCRASPTRDDYPGGAIRTRWNRFDNQCKINAATQLGWEFGRLVGTSRTADQAMVTCSADQAKPGGTGWTTLNSNEYAAVAFELNNNNGNQMYNDNDMVLIDQTTWVTRITEFSAPTTSAVISVPSSLPWTLPATTVAAAGGYPSLVLDITLELTTTSTITNQDYPSFAPWNDDTPTYYQIQEYTHPNVQTMFSAGDIAPVTLNFTTGETAGIVSLSTASSGTVLRLNLQRFYDNDPPKQVYFYIGAQNMFGTAISGLYKYTLICPLAPIPTINHNNWASTSTLRILMPLGGWTTATFNTWTVIEQIVKCSFLRYEATINATTSAFINYPYNSPTCDYTWANCRIVNVLPSVEMKLHFDLSVRRVSPWNDLYGTTQFEIWVTNCPTLTTTFAVAAIPLEVFERSAVPAFQTRSIATTYYAPYVTQVPSGPTVCPPVLYELVTVNDDTVTYSHPSVALFNPSTIATTYLTVMTDTPAELSFKLKIWNFLGNYGTGTLSFIICGLEKIEAKTKTLQDYIFQQTTVNKFFVTSQADLVSFFTVTYDKTNDCGLKFFSAYDISEFEVLWPASKPQVSMPGAFLAEQLIVDKSYVQKSRIRIRATTKGLNYATLDYLVYVCKTDSLQKSAAHKSFSILDTLFTANHDGLVNKYVFYFESELSKMFQFKDCECCSNSTAYMIINTTTGERYTKGDVYLDKDNNFVIDTLTPKHKYKLSFRAYVNTATSPRCNFLTPVDINFSIEICGSETVLVQDKHKPIEITKIWNKERNFVMPDIRSYFSLEDEYKSICPITSYKLWNSTIFPPEVTGPTVWGTFIKLDPKTFEIQVNHNNNPGVANNTVFTIYITAQTWGYQTGQKVFRFNLTYPPLNLAPKFKRQTDRWVIYISGEEQMKCAYKYPIVKYELPGIVDLESNNMTMEVSMEHAPCDCLKIFKKDKLHPYEVPMIWVEVDQRLVTHVDQGVYKAEIYMYDEEYHKSYQNGYGTFEVEIIYNVGKRYYDPLECYRVSNKTDSITRESLYREQFNDFIAHMLWTKSQFHVIDGTTLIGPVIKPERNALMASAALINNTIANFKQISKFRNYSEGGEPVHIYIDWISEDGFIYVKFNQELLVPFDQNNYEAGIIYKNSSAVPDTFENSGFGVFKNANKNYSSEETSGEGRQLRGRKLFSLEQINVTQHLFNFKYRLRNKIEPEKIIYDITLEDWHSDGLLLQMNFLYPEFVSYFTNFDFAMMKVINPSLFVSAQTGVELAEDYHILQDSFPRQYTHLNETSVLSLDISTNVFISIVRISAYFLMGYTIWFGYSFNDMWVLFYVLQLICYLVHSDVPLPMPALVFLKHLTSFIEFDLFSPLFYLKVAVPRFSLYRFLFSIPFHFPYKSKYQKINYLDDFSVYFFWILLVSIISFYVNCLFKKKSSGRSLTAFVNAFSKYIDSKLYFNGYIRIYSIMYVKIALSIFAHIHVWAHAMFYQDTFVWIATIVLLLLTGFLFGWIVRILYRYRLILGYDHNVKVFSNLYEGIHLYKNRTNVWYFPIFLARRLIFAAVPYIFFPFHAGLQILGWLLLSTFSLLWYAHHRAHLEFRRMWLEIFNEFMFIVVLYNLIGLSDFNFYERTYHDLSLLFIILVCIIIVVNISQILLYEWKRWRDYRELLKRQQQWRDYLERRRELERILVQKLQHNIEILKTNPDAWKPKMKRIIDKPEYYKQKISYKLKETKWEKISHLTDPELTAKQMQKRINHSIYEELGNFGDIMQLSRIQLLSDYCQIRKKGQEKVTYYQIDKLAPLPDRLQEFPISFNQSSKNRWSAYHMKVEEREEYLRQLAALRAREALEAKRRMRGFKLPSFRFGTPSKKKQPVKSVSKQKIEDLSGLSNLDTNKAIGHFQGVWMFEKDSMPAKKITIIEKVKVEPRTDTMKDLINHSDSEDIDDLDEAIRVSDSVSDAGMSLDQSSVGYNSIATSFRGSSRNVGQDLYSIREEPELENSRPSINETKKKKQVIKASSQLEVPQGIKYKPKKSTHSVVSEQIVNLKFNDKELSQTNSKGDIFDFSPRSNSTRKSKKKRVSKKNSRVHFEDD